MRKLLPENWGFLCPVHTPDGGPCGLLNHLAANCTVVARPFSEESFSHASSAGTGSEPARTVRFDEVLSNLLVSLGMIPHAALGSVLPASQLAVLLDGRVIGGAPPHVAYRISRALRIIKARTSNVAAQPQTGARTQASVAQSLAVNELLRTALLGKTSLSDTHKRKEGRSNDEKALSGSRAGSGATAGRDVILPPTLEVAFIPPSWWDADIDPHIANGAAALERGLTAGMFASPTAPHSAMEDTMDGDLKGGDTIGEPAQTKLAGLFPGLFLQTTAARLVRPVIQVRNYC